MSRVKRSEAPDTATPVSLTVSLIDRLVCPSGRTQAFLRDSEGNGLRVRVTSTGAKAFVFEGSLDNKTIRRTIGSTTTWTIAQARTEARRLALMLDAGVDPREADREAAEAKAAEHARRATEAAAAEAERRASALTVGQAWERYIEERRPHWGARNYIDHLKAAQAGGTERKRAAGVLTKPGPLAPLMSMRLVDLNAQAVDSWATKEAADRPARVRLALRLLKAFLRWAADEPDLKGRVDTGAASAKKAKEAAGRPARKNDYLQREQLAPWFAAVRSIDNPVTAAYLQCLLLTGARREELATLRWEDVNFQWRGISMRDKIEGERMVPLTPFVESLLRGLPRRNEWVFSATRVVDMAPKNTRRRARYHASNGTEAPTVAIVNSSASGRIVAPDFAHRRACAAAGIEGLTLHGLRRSFASLCEWLDIPGGVSAQIQGHAPQGVREQNYIRRPLDLLRVHHERIEAWILDQANIPATERAQAPAAPLAAVAHN